MVPVWALGAAEDAWSCCWVPRRQDGGAWALKTGSRLLKLGAWALVWTPGRPVLTPNRRPKTEAVVLSHSRTEDRSCLLLQNRFSLSSFSPTRDLELLEADSVSTPDLTKAQQQI
ncbi:hypothetical protein PIB30_027843 [Stylosanthes scabra]|uniref:Uncharacterized protein n=1 Tax=Stylosanthes scabra TaxID=79078 RepID=A0ABU6UA08_9FABA|nr:hypothetical protein [Stylosanthes scabra]